MASNDLFLRSDADKSETSVDNDLRLRSDTDKTAVAAAGPPKHEGLLTNIGKFLR